jgi:shikimate kinase
MASMGPPDTSSGEIQDPASAVSSSPLVPGTRIVLLGMMGAGKTTVGRLLAGRLGVPYLDNDEAVRAMTGREPAEIRDTDGESALHELESAALRWALDGPPPIVIGAAGWIAEDPRAPRLLGRDATVVWLRATPETLRARIGGGEGRRVEATDLEWLTRHASGRAPAYAALADLVIDVDARTPEEVADAISASIGSQQPHR